MNETNYNDMSLDELRRYVLTHREDARAFQAYIDFSKATGRMINIDLTTSLFDCPNESVRLQSRAV